MKKSIILLVVLSVSFLTGCDFFRNLAGRPTSEDIKEKKTKIERSELLAKQEAERQQQRRLDSLRVLEIQTKDSLAALDTIGLLGGTILNPKDLGGLSDSNLGVRYQIIVGSFRKYPNAEAFLHKIQKAGYPSSLIKFKNGLIAVGVCPSNKIVEIKSSLNEIKNEEFCPKDVWVLLNE